MNIRECIFSNLISNILLSPQNQCILPAYIRITSIRVIYELPAYIRVTSIYTSYQHKSYIRVTSINTSYHHIYELPAYIRVTSIYTSYQHIYELPAYIRVTSIDTSNSIVTLTRFFINICLSSNALQLSDREIHMLLM